MKRVLCVTAVLLLCLSLTALPAAAQPLDNETTVVITRNSGETELTPSQNESCFWEYPTLTAGQHRDDGVLWLFNKSGRNATVTLADFHLPTDEAAVAYLKALKLTVRVDGKVIFDDTYDKAAALSIKLDVPKGEKKPVNFELGCDFSYSGESNPVEVIYGKYTVEYHGGGIFSSWIFYVALAVVAAAVVVFTVVRKKKKST